MHLMLFMVLAIVSPTQRAITDYDVRAALAMAIATYDLPKADPAPAPPTPSCSCSNACVCGCNEGLPCTCKVVPEASNMLAQNMTCVNGKCYPSTSFNPSTTTPSLIAAPKPTYYRYTQSYQAPYYQTQYPPTYTIPAQPAYFRGYQPVQPAFYQRTYYIR